MRVPATKTFSVAKRDSLNWQLLSIGQPSHYTRGYFCIVSLWMEGNYYRVQTL